MVAFFHDPIVTRFYYVVYMTFIAFVLHLSSIYCPCNTIGDICIKKAGNTAHKPPMQFLRYKVKEVKEYNAIRSIIISFCSFLANLVYKLYQEKLTIFD